METIGDRILSLRENLDMKQKKLADKVGITEATLSRYENNKREPRGAIVAKLAMALNVSTDYLLSGIYIEKDPRIKDLDKEFTPKEQYDFAKRLQNFREELLDQDAPLYNGEPMDGDDVERILAALEFIDKHSKIGAKKFTPNKYKK